MRGLFDFLVEPNGDRYNNSISVGDKSLILNTEVSNHQYINREARVLEVPIYNNTNIKKGDILMIHHNVFRRWYNVKGIEKNSRSYLSEGKYLITEEQVYLKKGSDNKSWEAMEGYCFIQPIKSTDNLSVDTEQPLVGIVSITDGSFKPGALIGFSPGDEFEFIVEGKRMYRIMTKYINTMYEYTGNEEEYNPSWASSS